MLAILRSNLEFVYHTKEVLADSYCKIFWNFIRFGNEWDVSLQNSSNEMSLGFRLPCQIKAISFDRLAWSTEK